MDEPAIRLGDSRNMNTPMHDHLVAYYEIQSTLEDWTPVGWNEDTHVLLFIREKVGLDNSEILKNMDW